MAGIPAVSDRSISPRPAPAGPAGTAEASLLAAPLVDRLASDWRAGRRTAAEDLLAATPGLGELAEVSVRLIYEEFCLREECGAPADPAEFLRRFPRWRDELGVLLGCHEALGACLDEPAFPEAGEEIAGFSLVAELGRGALGRVFLATQPSLADRPVVLKLTPARGGEHRALARLQQAHIVPLLSAQDLPDRGLRALCMPYLGGTTLDRILDDLVGIEPRRRTGRDLLDALDRPAAAAPGTPGPGGPARDFLGGETYVRAICWVASCLADGLDHARRRGLIHLDVKPSNVLLTAEGMPMLLDFHLARAPLRAGESPPDGLGGTPGYMAPEQEGAMAAIREGRPVPGGVDSRADVHAVGVLLHQALAGAMPPGCGGSPSRSIRRRNPGVGAGLAAIVARCLAPDPRRRYRDAGELGEDLRRFLDHRPLRHAPDRSLPERYAKWRKRSPAALSRAGSATLAALGLAGLAFSAWVASARRLDDAAAAIELGRAHREAGAPREALGAFLAGLEGLGPDRLADRLTPGLGEIRGSLADQADRARRARLAAELRELADHARSPVASDLPDSARSRDLLAALEGFWAARRAALARLIEDSPRDLRDRCRADLLDLGLLRAGLHVRLAGESRRDAARGEALRILGEVGGICGPSVVLERERGALAGALGLADQAEAARARASALGAGASWEWAALGRSLLEAGELDAAAESLARAAESGPGGIRLHSDRGECALRRRRYAEALDAFGACVALAPTVAAFRQNRGLSYAGLGVHDRAMADFEAARRLGIGPGPAAGRTAGVPAAAGR